MSGLGVSGFEGVQRVNRLKTPGITDKARRGIGCVERPRAAPRSGVVMIATVVCLLLTTALLASLLKSAGSRVRHNRQIGMRVQTEWLAESAADRAMWQLGQQPQYQGEVWKIPAAEFAGRYSAEIHIQVQAIATDPAQGQITARVVCTTAGGERIQRTRRWPIPLSNPQ